MHRGCTQGVCPGVYMQGCTCSGVLAGDVHAGVRTIYEHEPACVILTLFNIFYFGTSYTVFCIHDLLL